MGVIQYEGDENTVVFGRNFHRGLRIPGYHVVRLLLAGLVLIAAVFKSYQLATEPVIERGLLDSPWFLIGVIEFELIFGCWLLLGAAPWLTWSAAVVCFSLFASISAYKGVLGEASCGCFGRVAVNPWWTFGIDAAFVVLLLVCRPNASNGLPRRSAKSSAIACGLVALIIGMPAAWAMIGNQARSLSSLGMVVGDGNLVVLAPEEWVGKPFPLISHIDVGHRLSEGRWLVVLYYLGCPKCQELIADYKDLCDSNNAPANRSRVALIEIPKPSLSSTPIDFPAAHCLLGRMSDSRDWFVSAPTVLLLEDGQVRQAYEGDADKFSTLLSTIPLRPIQQREVDEKDAMSFSPK